MNSLRMEVRLRNGKKVVTTTPMSVNPVEVGYEFRKVALKMARDANTTILWESLRGEQVGPAHA